MTARGLYRTNTALSDAQILRNDTKRQRKLIGLTRKFSQQKLKKKTGCLQLRYVTACQLRVVATFTSVNRTGIFNTFI